MIGFGLLSSQAKCVSYCVQYNTCRGQRPVHNEITGGSCMEFAPTWEKLAKNFKGVKYGNVNIDDKSLEKIFFLF